MKKLQTKTQLSISEVLQLLDPSQQVVRVEYCNRDGKTGSLTCEKSVLARQQALYTLLLNAGADLPVRYSEAKGQLIALGQTCPETPRSAYRTCGFFKGTYVTPYGSYGREPSAVLVPQHPDQANCPIGMTRGNLKVYTRGIRTAVRRSRTLKLALALQCASIALGVVDFRHIAIFHLYGKGGAGKTLAASVAQSLIGRANLDDLTTYSTTEGAGEEEWNFRRHSLSILDETGALGADEYEVYATLKKLAYKFASGSGKRRMSYSKATMQLPTSKWSQFAISTGEKSLHDVADKLGNRVDDGVKRRFIEINCGGANSSGLFDIWQGDHPLSERKQEKMRAKLLATIRDNHGVGLPVLVQFLNSQHNLQSTFDSLVAQFVGNFDIHEGWSDTVTRIFGAVFAGGVFGIRAGVIPCREKSLLNSLKKL